MEEYGNKVGISGRACGDALYTYVSKETLCFNGDLRYMAKETAHLDVT